MLLMQPSRSKFSRNIIDCIHVNYSLPPGENPIADNKYSYYYYFVDDGYRILVVEVKWPGPGVDHPLLSSAKFKGRVELYLCTPSRS
jgi:hypothetical protein